MNLINWLIEPLQYPFMQIALGTAIFISIICAIFSCYIILKGWSLMGDAISHAVLPGVVIAFWIGIPLWIGALASGLFCASSIGYLKQHSRLKEDTLMGVIFSSMFAMGLVLFNLVNSDLHLMHILFGNLLGLTQQEFIQTALLSALIFAILFLKRKDFLLYFFDPTHTRVAGLSPKLLHYSLLLLLSLIIVIAMQMVGVILVISLLISPGITAYLLTKRFDIMIVLAILSAISSSIIGTFLSYHINADISPCIVLTQALFFALALLYSNLKLRYKNEQFTT